LRVLLKLFFYESALYPFPVKYWKEGPRCLDACLGGSIAGLGDWVMPGIRFREPWVVGAGRKSDKISLRTFMSVMGGSGAVRGLFVRRLGSSSLISA